MDETRARSIVDTRWLIVAITAATLIKLWLGLRTEGTWDVAAFQDQLQKTREFGAAAYSLTGKFGNPLNILPVPLLLARAAEFLTNKTGIHFAFWMRLPNILADVGSVGLVWKSIAQSEGLRFRFASILLMTLSPVSILISGFHGNIDPLMMFFVVLSASLIINKRSIWFAGMVFGLALNIKIVPLLFAPVIYFYLTGLRPRLQFCAAATIVFLIGVTPFVWQNPSGFYQSVFAHAGLYANWGWSVIAEMWLRQPIGNRYHPSGLHGTIAMVTKYLTMAFVLVFAFLMNRRRPPPPLFLQLAVVSCSFMFLTPGFGDQYLSWLVPWVVAVGLIPSVILNTTSGVYLLAAYTCAMEIPGCFQIRLYLNLICWVSVLVVLIFCALAIGKRQSNSRMVVITS